jgi:hypothetical protein
MAYRGYSVYINGTRAIQVENAEIRWLSNSESVITDDGYQGETEAHQTCEIKIDKAIPVEGDQAHIQLLDALEQKRDKDMAFGVVGGERLKGKFKVIDTTITSDMAKQLQKGSITLRGRVPKRISI